MKKLSLILLTLASLQVFAQTTGKKIYVKVPVKVVTPPTSPDFNYIVDNSDGRSGPQAVRMFGWRDNFSVTVNWGDGTIDSSFKDSSDYTMTHTYATNGVFNPTFKVINIEQVLQLFLNVTNSDTIRRFNAIRNLDKFPALQNLTLPQIDLVDLTNNAMNNLALPPTLVVFGLFDSHITSFDPVKALPALTELYIHSTNMTTFAPSKPLPATLTILSLKYNQWNSETLNEILIYLDVQTFNPGTKNLYLNQLNNITPTGAGLTAKASLEGKGWIISTD